MTSANHCAHCGDGVRDPGGFRVWTVFCSPEHCRAWQYARTEEQIVKVARGIEGNDVCQWCRSPLRSGYHDKGCPVRTLQLAEARAILASTADDLDGEALRLPPDPGFRPTASVPKSKDDMETR